MIGNYRCLPSFQCPLPQNVPLPKTSPCAAQDSIMEENTALTQENVRKNTDYDPSARRQPGLGSVCKHCTENRFSSHFGNDTNLRW